MRSAISGNSDGNLCKARVVRKVTVGRKLASVDRNLDRLALPRRIIARNGRFVAQHVFHSRYLDLTVRDYFQNLRWWSTFLR